MPFRCIDPAGASVQSLDLSTDRWSALAAENRERRHLRMPCCSAGVILRTSRRGMRHFVHTGERICNWAPETEAHLHLKAIAVAAARAQGWQAETEVAGGDPAAPWKADVLASNGRHKVAVEIQWSGQTNAETLARQERYRASGVQGLWLLRQPGFPVTRDLPAACIGGEIGAGFMALIPRYERMIARDRSDQTRWHKATPVRDFLEAAFAGQLQFGLPIGVPAEVTTYERTMFCWSCGAETHAVTRVSVSAGGQEHSFQVEDLDNAPKFRSRVLGALPKNDLRGPIRPRFSKTQRATRFSNGCSSCDALLGQHFLHYDYSDRDICRFATPVDDELHAMLSSDGAYDRWGVYR